ncbi:hypothetical protein Hdeb2414_s0021g00580001 [Helianthus debilis subsp. tardiflorus]
MYIKTLWYLNSHFSRHSSTNQTRTPTIAPSPSPANNRRSRPVRGGAAAGGGAPAAFLWPHTPFSPSVLPRSTPPPPV